MSELNLLRYLPGTSPVHRLWAGTKALAVLGVGIGLAVNPSWPAEAVLAGFLALALAMARIPWAARPHLPRWFWLWLGVGAVIALVSGGRPTAALGGLTVGLGSLGLWARFTCLAALALLSAAVLAWSTPLSELAPALARLGAPFRRRPLAWLHLPVDELALVVALAVRCLGLLLQELRLLVAARRIRGARRPRSWTELLEEGVDLLTATLVVATRRAGEMAEAMEGRGGLPARLPSGRGPGWGDVVAAAVISATVAGMILA
ncbi:MAG: CbiQ family ECF transporter T component [Acidimicrobiales bacterium]